MTEKTTISKAATNSASLRTTVPRSIVKHFDLKEGDSLRWGLSIRNSDLVIEVLPDRRPRSPPTEDTQVTRTRALAAKNETASAADQKEEKRRWRLR